MATSLTRCFNGDGSNPTYAASNQYCQYVPRSTVSGDLSNALQPEFNLSSYDTQGVDLQLDWSLNLSEVGLGSGRVTANSVVGYTARYAIQSFAGSTVNNYAGTFGDTEIDQFSTAHPNWKAVTTVGYGVGPVDVSLTWRYIGAMINSLKVTTPTSTAQGVPPINYFDVMGRWHFNKNLEFRAGIEDLLDQNPPLTATTPLPGTDPSTYDILGRRFSIGLTATF